MTENAKASSDLSGIARRYCAACPVRRGECPRCGTYWVEPGDGKRYGVRPADTNPVLAAGGDTTHPGWLDGLRNVVTR